MTSMLVDRNAQCSIYSRNKEGEQTQMAGALDGIKILDITNYIAGPFATMLLGDLGAEVYKIETPGAGDPFRTWDNEPKDYSPSFCGMNRNKKSITLDMKSPEGKEIFMQLAEG